MLLQIARYIRNPFNIKTISISCKWFISLNLYIHIDWFIFIIITYIILFSFSNECYMCIPKCHYFLWLLSNIVLENRKLLYNLWKATLLPAQRQRPTRLFPNLFSYYTPIIQYSAHFQFVIHLQVNQIHLYINCPYFGLSSNERFFKSKNTNFEIQLTLIDHLLTGYSVVLLHALS